MGLRVLMAICLCKGPAEAWIASSSHARGYSLSALTFCHQSYGDHLRDGIYELRIGLHGINYRMLYFIHSNRGASLPWQREEG